MQVKYTAHTVIDISVKIFYKIHIKIYLLYKNCHFFKVIKLLSFSIHKFRGKDKFKN